jgi:hypothetical protein
MSARRGRPPQLLTILAQSFPPGDQTRLEVMLERIRTGTSPAAAARGVGIPPSSFHRWMQLGAEPNAAPHLRDFFEAVDQARATWVTHLSLTVTRAAVRNPVLAMRLLRVLDPENPAWGA